MHQPKAWFVLFSLIGFTACSSGRPFVGVDGSIAGHDGAAGSVSPGPDGAAGSDADQPSDGGGGDVPACDPGQHACSVGCVHDDSPQTCGTSCSPCLPPDNGGTATCV